MPLPSLSHLQLFILSALLDKERTGPELRGLLSEQGLSKTLAAFYQLMSRMEDAKLVVGRYESKMVDDIPIKERHYKITGGGKVAYQEADNFYEGLKVKRNNFGIQGA